jgi:ABC transporter
MRDLIHDFTGVVRDGQMLLVLGRPGSGCSTFLKAVANKREAFASVEGEVSYGGIPAQEQAKHYKGEVNYNEEDDQHFPTLTVEQTLDFSLLNKTKKHEKGDIPIIIGALLKMFGISHTRHTLVGDVSILIVICLLKIITNIFRRSSEAFQVVRENVSPLRKHLRQNLLLLLGTIVPEVWMHQQLSIMHNHFES